MRWYNSSLFMHGHPIKTIICIIIGTFLGTLMGWIKEKNKDKKKQGNRH
jgi:hypothetical protein